jgi:nickel/cobalt transporter (NicO) family protein
MKCAMKVSSAKTIGVIAGPQWHGRLAHGLATYQKDGCPGRATRAAAGRHDTSGQCRFSALIAIVLLLLIASLNTPAVAHPMGNFSVGHYTAISLDRDSLRLRYRLDLAEIPTAEQMRFIDSNGDGQISDSERADYLKREVPKLTAGQTLKVSGQIIPLKPIFSDLTERPGASDLPTLWITIDYQAALPNAATTLVIDYQDQNFPQRSGWREIVASVAHGVIVESDVPTQDRSQQLAAYPADLSSPPRQHEAHVVFSESGKTSFPDTLPTGVINSPSIAPVQHNVSTPRDPLTQLFAHAHLSATAILFSLVIAFALGSFHALSPGHGKTVVAAYLVGSRGTARHALMLGAIVTMTHVAGVFALGIVVLFASKYVVPEQVYPWLGFVSGLMIAAIGLWQFTRRYAAALVGAHAHGHGPHEHHHGPGGHRHDLPEKLTPGGLIALGVSGGILPCPSALIVLLSAIAMGRVAFGLLLIVFFSMGLAMVLTAIGLAMLYAHRLFDRYAMEASWLSRLPMASSLLVTVLGLAIAVRSLISGGIVQIHLTTSAANGLRDVNCVIPGLSG